MKLYKLVLSLSFFVLAGGILWSHRTASTFPGLHGSLFIATLLLTAYFLFVRDRQIPYRPLITILPIIFIAVVYRTYVYLFPSSMPGIDSVTYGSMIARITNTGTFFSINIGFYEAAPVSALIPTVFRLATGVPVSESLVIYPIALGIITPAATASLTLLIATTKRTQLAAVAAVFSTIATISVLFAIRPIAQSVGIAFWAVMILLIARYSNYKSRRFLVLVVIILIAQVFTHKLPLSIIFITLIVFAAVSLVLYSVRIGMIDPAMIRSHGLMLALLAGVFLFVQWAYTTTFIKTVANWGDIYVQAGSNVTISPENAIQNETAADNTTLLQSGIGGSQPRPVRAIAAHQTGLSGILERRLYAIASLPLGFLSGLYVNYKEWESPTVKVLFVSAIVPAIFLVASVRNPVTNPGATPPPERLVSFLEPVLIPFFAVFVGVLAVKSFGTTSRRKQWSSLGLKIVSIALVGLFLSTQLFAPAGVLDFPGYERWYLNSQETHAKDFGYDYVDGNVHTDWYALVAGPPNSRLTGLDAEFRDEPYTAIGEPFVYGTIAEQQYEYVLFRTNAGVYKTTAGSYLLPYGPQQSLNAEYNRIYSNNGAVMYIQPGD